MSTTESYSDQGSEVVVGFDAERVLPEFTEHALTARRDLRVVLGDLATPSGADNSIDESELPTGEN